MDSFYPPDLPLEGQHGDPSTLLKSVDKSEALFSMYLDRSDEDDRKTTERWKGECDAILIFTGLFSAALAALISVSIQGLQPSSQDTSAFYLRNIYHVLANSTTFQPIVLPTPSDPPKFSPPKSAVLVNSLWFLSLLMSLTGALIAVFIQQWAQSYLEATQGRLSPRDRARIRTFHAEGIEKFYLHRVTRAVPILIHISLFLFFAGLPVFLFNVNRTVFNVVVTWLALCVAGYACITLIPVFCQNSPFYSPLSSWTWWCVTNAQFILFRLFKSFMFRDSLIFRWYDTHYAKPHLHWPSLRAMQKAAGRFALKLSSDIDYRALSWTFKTLNDDDEFEQFFDALPSLCDSEELVDAPGAFIKPNEEILSHALIGMMDRTLLSDLVPEEVKQRRIIICTKVIGATFLLGPWWTLRRVLLGDWHGFSRSIHFGLFVQGWKSISPPVTTFYVQYVVAVTLASVQKRDDHWFQLASGQLSESKSLLWYYCAGNDSILLANAILIIRRMIQTFSRSENRHRIDIEDASSKTLELICRFDIQNTLPEYQHQFCSLWNQLVDAVQNNTHRDVTPLCRIILKTIRRLYITLHEKTVPSPMTTDDGNLVLDDSMSYPRCRTDGHRHSPPVPELQLDELPRNDHQVTDRSTDMIPAISSTVVPVRPPTFTSPYYPVAPGPYPLTPGLYSHSADPDIPRSTPTPVPDTSFISSTVGLETLPPAQHQPLAAPTSAAPVLPGIPQERIPSPILSPGPHISPREATSFLIPRRSRQSQRHRNRSHRREDSQSLGSSESDSESPYSASSYDAPRAQPAPLQPPPPPLPAGFTTPAYVPSNSPMPMSNPKSAPPPPQGILAGLPTVRPYTVPLIEPFVTRDLGHRRPSPTERPPRPSAPVLTQFAPPQPPPETPITRLYAGRRPPVDDTRPDFLDGVHRLRGQRVSAAWDSRPEAEPGKFILIFPPQHTLMHPVAFPKLYPPSSTPGTVPQFAQPGVVPPAPLPSARSINDAMATIRETRLMHLASLEQQREQTRYINSFNEWLGHDVEDRQAEIRGVSARIDQLHEDLSRLLYSREPFYSPPVPPPGPGVGPGSFGGPGASGAPGMPVHLGTVPLGGPFVGEVDSQQDGHVHLAPSASISTSSSPESPSPQQSPGSTPTPVLLPGQMTPVAAAPPSASSGPVLIPMPSLGAGDGSMTLKFDDYGEFSGLLYHSPHSVVYGEVMYPTALHLYEARKFLDHRPDLADRIRQCGHVEGVVAISAELAEFTRRDWGNVALSTMDDVLYHKFRQHSDLRALLLNTYPVDLVYVESGDPFWGDGAGVGMNELGKSLMRVRERLRIEGEL